jgi:hypothetical protein
MEHHGSEISRFGFLGLLAVQTVELEETMGLGYTFASVLQMR